MGSLLSRTVEIQIFNNTQSITLRDPRTYFERGSCSKPPPPELLPGSSGTCRFQGSFPYSGVSGILVYEAESFTLAIYFSNPMELGLELSLSKAHRGSLASTYARMATGAYSSSFLDAKFDRVPSEEGVCLGFLELSDGPVKVMASITNAMISSLKVELEEQ